MFTVGLTGGIGSGKTAVSDRFQALGINIVDADVAARTVVEKGKPALDEIAAHFGKDILHKDGSLNRATLRKTIFQNKSQRQWLEQLLHPLIYKEIKSALEQSSSPYTLLVSPLLVETGRNQLTHRVLVVDTDEQLQLERTARRDNSSPEEVKAIMASQATQAQRLNYADDVIINNKSLSALDKAVDKLHRQYLRMAKEYD